MPSGRCDCCCVAVASFFCTTVSMPRRSINSASSPSCCWSCILSGERKSWYGTWRKIRLSLSLSLSVSLSLSLSLSLLLCHSIFLNYNLSIDLYIYLYIRMNIYVYIYISTFSLLSLSSLLLLLILLLFIYTYNIYSCQKHRFSSQLRVRGSEMLLPLLGRMGSRFIPRGSSWSAIMELLG